MSILSPFENEDEDDPQPSRMQPLEECEFHSQLPDSLLSRKDIRPHEKELLHTVSILAQQVDYHWDTHVAHDRYLREMERDITRIKKWKRALSVRLTALLILLVLFFQYGIPLIRETLSSGNAAKAHQRP